MVFNVRMCDELAAGAQLLAELSYSLVDGHAGQTASAKIRMGPIRDLDVARFGHTVVLGVAGTCYRSANDDADGSIQRPSAPDQGPRPSLLHF